MKNKYRCGDVFAVIVTYNPDIAVLDELLDSLLPQVGGAIVVDNGSAADMLDWQQQWAHENICLHLAGRNLGIAAAQNIGIEIAKKSNPEFVILSDQDSIPAKDMVFHLRDVACKLMADGEAIAAVGPRYMDIRQNNPPPFIQINGFRLKRQYCEHPGSIVKVDYLIASGCLMPIQALNAVGGMNEHLFIDYVDIEWGLRAKYLGLQSFGACAASMIHSLGDKPIRFLGKNYPLHSPLRHYYHFRNGVWLYKQKYISKNWKIADGIRLLLKFIFYSVFARPQTKHFKMMLLGVIHGITSRLGKI